METKETTGALTDLSFLLGRWQGRGVGSYPTIESFSYQETFLVAPIPGSAALHYVQRTGLVDAQGNPLRPSHWESGVVRLLGEGRVVLACVHVNARTELLDGTIESIAPGIWRMQFESTLIGNDPRMRHSSRSWTIQEDTLTYEMYMATEQVDRPTLHLEGQLERVEAA